ncbi:MULTISPECIES: DUF2516 family protein [Actinosynnema]|uniref:DUF2516 family protein n=2 Tax=Actinosynnema TaxID=40566 RepID=C6WPL8_ACTMD|nr:hypothetical protein Amir_6772 [Actinosynnema mirum DSM 43827]ATE57601.1 DUF2516 domain-containing protein [Actinosynnema pretiosum]
MPLFRFPPADVAYLDAWVLFLIYYVALFAGVFAFAHAVTQRAEAYQAAERMTKPAWMGITGGGALALLLFSLNGAGGMFWLIGVTAVSVYLVDVRPRLIEVQRGPRW